MKKLTELLDGPKNISALLMGQPGAGKTVAACSFPYPILLLDFDGKADSAAMYYKDDKERLENIDVVDLSAKLDIDPMTEFIKLTRDITKQLQDGTFPYKTLIVDSITTFSALTLKHIVKTNPGIKRVQSKQGFQPGMQDYGILRREFGRIIPGMLGLPLNVVMTAHIHIEKDEFTGELHRRPLMDGSFAEQLPVYFKEVYLSYVTDKGEYMWQTQSDRKYNLRSQVPGLGKTIPASYKEIQKQLGE